MRFAAIVMLITWGGLCSFAAAEERAPVAPSFLIDLEPEDKVQLETFFLHPELFGLWKQALAHPEAEMHRKTAEAITAAQKSGHEGLSVFQPDLLKVLQQEKPNTAARYAAAHALIAIESRDSAAALFEASQSDGKDMRQMVEPVLGDWGFAPIHDVWVKRVQTPDTPRRELILATRGLSKCQVATANADLLKLAMSTGVPADIRLAAAQAAGSLAESGFEPSAILLTTQGAMDTVDRLCAVSLLVKHRSAQAIELNSSLAQDVEPAVAAVALRTLFATDPQTVLPLAEESLKSPDATVRRVAIEAYLTLPTTERLQALAAHLNDPHPGLRIMIREGFITHQSKAEFADLILELSTQALNGEDWRGQEQGAFLMVTFGRKEVSPRLADLLPSERHEVAIVTAWALRVFAVPETAPAIYEQLERQSKLTTFSEQEIETQICHLCEALAVMKYKKATPTLRLYIPKRVQYSPIARAEAIWALGQIYEDVAADPAASTDKPKSAIAKAAELLGIKDKSDTQIVEELAGQFMGRIEDTESQNPEATEVRRACALAIGRMKAVSQLENLQTKIGSEVTHEPVEFAMRWAIFRLSGELLPITPPRSFEQHGWFLEPFERAQPRSTEVAQ